MSTLEKNKIIPLVDEENEDILNFSDDSISNFIQYIQREEITLNNGSVFVLYYLGEKYEIQSLVKSTKDYIEEYQNELILQIMSFFQSDSNFDTTLYEKILSANLVNYASDDRLLTLKFPIIYRIVDNTPNKSDSKIIRFLFQMS